MHVTSSCNAQLCKTNRSILAKAQTNFTCFHPPHWFHYYPKHRNNKTFKSSCSGSICFGTSTKTRRTARLKAIRSYPRLLHESFHCRVFVFCCTGAPRFRRQIVVDCSSGTEVEKFLWGGSGKTRRWKVKWHLGITDSVHAPALHVFHSFENGNLCHQGDAYANGIVNKQKYDVHAREGWYSIHTCHFDKLSFIACNLFCKRFQAGNHTLHNKGEK